MVAMGLLFGVGGYVLADDTSETITIEFEVDGPYCGNTVVDPGENCDDGNSSNTDACLNSCTDASCGDGYVQVGIEDCDDGGSNGACPSACSTTCEINDCGGTPPDPTPTVNILTTSATYNSISLSWTVSGGTITGCEIAYDVDGPPYDDSTDVYTLAGTLYSTTLTGLLPDTTYYVAVTCTNSVNNSDTDSDTILTQSLPAGVDQVVTIFATPELRVEKPGGNDDTDFTVFIFNEVEDTLLATISSSTDSTGTYVGTHSLPTGTDLVAVYKSNSHLATKIVGVTITGGSLTLDFTAGGRVELLAGDTSPEHPTYSNLQDNTVNLLDLTYVIADGIFNLNNKVADLNRDDTVTVLDITLLLKNYNQEGDVIPLVL